MKTRSIPRIALAATSGVFVLSGCVGLGGSSEPDPEDAALANVTPEAEEKDEDAQEEPESAERDEPEVLDTQIDEAVYYSGVEFQFEAMTVVDLDGESGDSGDSARVRGLELVFDVNAYNPSNDTIAPNAPVVLRWDEPGTDNVSEINGHGDFKQVPGESSTSGEVIFELDPDSLKIYDPDSARVVIGSGGEATATLPLGTSVDPVTRFPVVQDHLENTTLDAGPLAITFNNVEVRWNYGTPEQGQASEDEALAIFAMTIENTDDGQVCTRRGAGKTMYLKDENGQGYVDLGLSERCFQAGTSEDVLTGFEVDSDYDGTYDLEFDVDPVGDDVWKGDINIELRVGEGNAPSTSR